jgi:hypothetical protein
MAIHSHKRSPTQIQTSILNQQVRDFLEREVSAHVADIRTLDPPPDRVVGALTTGEFSWGTFMRMLGAREAGVFVIALLRKILAKYNAAFPPNENGWIFRGEKRMEPLNLDNLSRRDIRLYVNGAWFG